MPELPIVQLELHNFNGPLDLLLRLIEEQRLNITAISLAQVTDQYMQAVTAMQAPDPDVLADFLVIGAKLLVIKTRALLPRPPLELAPKDEEDVGDQLARQLAEYQRFKQAATQLREWEAQGRRAYGRHAAPPLPPPSPPPPLNIDIAELVAAMKRRIALTEQKDETVPVPTPKIVTIGDVTQMMRAQLSRQEWISFEDLLSLALTRNEVIVTLWTTLELFKQHILVLKQPQLFGPIMLGRGPAFEDTVRVEVEN
jgi:segregation and condensation protein A